MAARPLSKLTTPTIPTLYFAIMSVTPDDTNREARTRIADAIVTAVERGQTLTLEDLEAAGQPTGALGPDREAQAHLIAAWTTRAVELVAKARATQNAADKQGTD
jgi:hypothetical protein